MDIRARLNTFFKNSKDKSNKPLKKIKFDGITLDLSRNIVSKEIFLKMHGLLTDTNFSQQRKKLFDNKLVSETESKKVSFVNYRNNKSYDRDIERMSNLYLDIKNNKIKNFEGGNFNTIVHIGIGGSSLGANFLSDALEDYKSSHFISHFISSGDLAEINDLLKKIDIKTTVFIFVSKSFKTDETIRIKLFIDKFITKKYFKYSDYIFKNQYIAVTANTILCKKLNFSKRNIFTLQETIPGRFSVFSPVTLINMFEIGIQNYKRLVKGVRAMDLHFLNCKYENNIPINLALINIWNINFLSKYGNIVVPYSYRLRNLSNYLQQIEMESNGKSITKYDENSLNFTSPILFGGSGTECQHSFFQAAHQGTLDVYFDFIYLKSLRTSSEKFLSANVHAQADLLFRGKKTKKKHKSLIGNSPSTLVGIDKLNPDRIGKLISMYEHKVFVEGIIWEINSYDQWGVEEGKIQARKNLSKN